MQGNKIVHKNEIVNVILKSECYISVFSLFKSLGLTFTAVHFEQIYLAELLIVNMFATNPNDLLVLVGLISLFLYLYLYVEIFSTSLVGKSLFAVNLHNSKSKFSLKI